MQKIDQIMDQMQCDVAGAMVVLFREEPDVACAALHRLLSDLYCRLHSVESHCEDLREANDRLSKIIDELRTTDG